MVLVHTFAEPAEAPSLLPEAYLRRFPDERGDLWVLDRKQGIVRRQSPEVTAAERELYILPDEVRAAVRGTTRRGLTSPTVRPQNAPFQARSRLGDKCA
jgi:hypothetical protein